MFGVMLYVFMMLLVETLELLRFYYLEMISRKKQISSFSFPTLSVALYGALTGLCRPVCDERFFFTLGC
jgi:hypothetical protein